MKTVGRRKANIEEVRNRMVIDEKMSGWALPQYSHLLLPVEMGKQIDAVSRKARRQAYARAEKRRNKKYERDLGSESAPVQTLAERKKAEADAADAAALLASLPKWLGLPAGRRAFSHVLFDEACLDVLQLTADSKTGGSTREANDKKRVTDLVARWRAIGGTRLLSPPEYAWRARLDTLAADMPNFAAVIDYLRGEFVLAAASNKPVRLTPILLDGPPGIGKTTFARALSSIMDSGFGTVSMETAQTATALSGSEEYWGNSRTGLLFNLLIEKQFSNPVMLVDEVDKARGGQNGYDPLASLYGLLEPTSAATWFDLSMPLMKLDASKVIWILTSNDKSRVPKPLLSRMRVFDVAALDAKQSLDTATQIFKREVAALEIDFDPTLPPAALSAIAATSPREMHRIVRELVAKAFLAGRRQVLAEDLRACQIVPAAPTDASKPAAGGTQATGKVMKLRVIEAEVEMPPDAAKVIAEAAEAVEADVQKKNTLH